MDSQIYNLKELNSIKDELPTVKYTIQVISKIPIKNKNSASKLVKFLNDIKEGDLILLEYPPSFIPKASFGISTFSVKINNFRTGRSLSVRASMLESSFWNYIKEIKVIE